MPDDTKPDYLMDNFSSMSQRNANRPSDGAYNTICESLLPSRHRHFKPQWARPTTPTSPIFRYPNLSLLQSQPSREDTETLHLRLSGLFEGEDRRAICKSEGENDVDSQSIKVRGKDIFNTVSETSPAPNTAHRRPDLPIFSALQSCSSGAPWYSEPEKEYLESYDHDNGIAQSTKDLRAPLNLPHEEPQKVHERYHGTAGPSSQWSRYCKPAVEDEEDDAIKCYDTEVSNIVGPAITLPRPQPSDWFESKLERKTNSSSTSIHANLRNIDDVKRCPAVHASLNVDDSFRDSELQFWRQKRQEILNEIRQVHAWQALFGQPPAHITPNNLIARVAEVDSMINFMIKRGFRPTDQWNTEYSRAADLADRGNIYPLMAFVIAEFGAFFQSGRFASEDHQGQEISDLHTITNKGVIDACRAVKSLISMGSSRPTKAWCKQYDDLTTSAQDRGDIKPLIEFVRCEAENISVRNASERAAKVKELFRQSYQIIDLDEFGTHIRPNIKDGAEIVYYNGSKGRVSDHSHGDFHHEYDIWLTKNYQREAQPFKDRFIYSANYMHPIVAGPDDFEAKEPFEVTLSHYFDEFKLLASISIVALAVRVTPSVEQHCVDTYALVWLRDSSYHERFNSPSRIRVFSAQGQSFDLDEEAIIAMIKTRLKANFEGMSREEVESDRASSSTQSDFSWALTSGTTLRCRDSDRSQSQSPESFSQPYTHLTPEQTREMHPNVVAQRGMTLVPLHDFPDLPADQENLDHYRLSIGGPPSRVFVNCGRCHTTLASFEGVDVEPTVARREEDEPGDSYIVTSTSSLAKIIASVDRVKRVWLHIGTHKYFMRANEAGVERTHECNSIQDTPRTTVEQDECEAATGNHRKNDGRAPDYGGLRDFSPPEPPAEGRQTSLRDLGVEVDYDRPGSLPPCNLGQSRDEVQLPPPENAQSQLQPITSKQMASSIQYLHLQTNFPTAKLKSLFPCTIISICEQRGIKQGVYQDVIGYGSIFRAPEERGHTVYLDIRDSCGGYIGRLSRVCHYQIRLLNGQVVSLTAADEKIEESMDSMPFPPESASSSRSQTTGLRGGAPAVEYWIDTEDIAYCSDDEKTGLRERARRESSENDGNGPGDVPKEESNSTGTMTETPVSPSQSLRTASISGLQSSDHLVAEWISSGVSAQQTNQQAPSGGGPKQRAKPIGLSCVQLKAQQKRCTCSTRKGKEPARSPRVPPGVSMKPLMIIGCGNLSDDFASSKKKKTACDLVYEGAPEIFPSHGQEQASSMSHSISLNGQGPPEALKDFAVASRHQLVPSNDPLQPHLPQDSFERIPTWLQAGQQSDLDQSEGEEPVLSESYKKWLRDMYTRPSYSTCMTDPDPGPSFQDFWRNREGGKPATMANGSVVDTRPRLEGEYRVPPFDESEYVRMVSDGHIGRNKDEQSSFKESFRSDTKHLGRPHRRWQGTDFQKEEHILREEPSRIEEISSLSTALQNILSRYLRGRRISDVRADSSTIVREG